MASYYPGSHWSEHPPRPDTALVALKNQYFSLWKEAEARATSLDLDLKDSKRENDLLRFKLERIQKALDTMLGHDYQCDECGW